MDKKGFEIQFNWLFVLVAGTAILLFFTVVVLKQKSVAETSTKATVLKSIEAIITGAGVNSGITNIISIPESSIDVSCNRISLGGVSKQYQKLILFAPSVIKGNKIISQTLDFSVPYRATNLLYVTSPKLRYIIIGDNNLAKEINKSLPSELKKEFYKSAPPKIRNENNYKIKFIFLGDVDEKVLKEFEGMQDSDVTAININGDDEKGVIEYYQKNRLTWALKGMSYYLSKSSLLGAVYTDNLETYQCNMEDVFSRLNLVTKIFMERTQKLKTGHVSDKELQCNQFYENALDYLNQIYSAASEFNQQNIDTIANAAKSLVDENKNAQIYSCALIY